MQRYSGWCQIGGKNVTISGLNSSNVFQQSYPLRTVTVYVANTLTLATIYSDNSSTSKANPFTAGSDGGLFFYAANGRYDVTCTGGSPSVAITYPDNLLLDLGGASGLTSINSQTGPTITLQVGTAGTDFGITNPSSNVIQINCPTASSSIRGCLSSADWTTFNGKQAPLSFSAPLNLSGTAVTLVVPIGIVNGGTGQTTAANAFNALSPLTTKGDFLTNNGAGNVRVPIGTDNYVVVADHTQGVGWAWKACAFCQLTDPLGVAHGGTGVTSGTSGGVGCYTGSTTYASSAALAVGNPLIGGGAGACPGTTGPFTSYNSLTLAGQGMPAILYSPALSSTQSATVGPTTMIASTNAGLYELCYYAVITQAATSSSSLTPKFSWNDGSARDTTSLVAANVPNFAAYTGNAANAVLNGCVTIAAATAQAITFTFTYASSGGTAMNYVYAVTAKEIR
jgi:hypothetical protein